jgi:transposase InsO family protein
MLGPNQGTGTSKELEAQSSPGGEHETSFRINKVNTRLTTQHEPLASFGVYGAQELAQLQNADITLKEVMRWVKKTQRPDYKTVVTESPALRHYWHIYSSLFIQNNILYKEYHTKDGLSKHIQFMVPDSMKSEVLRLTHNSLLGGHLGQKKTKRKLQQRFYWFEMREDVNVWICKCDICSRMKHNNRKPRAALGDMRVGAPLDRISVDLVGPLPETPRGNRHILVITDHFSKWAEAYPVKDQTALTCADVICKEFITKFGCPLYIHTDQGRCFEAELFQEICKLLEIQKTRTSPRNPKCNGLVERFNKTLIQMIKSFIRGDATEWDLNLQYLTAAYRASVQESTKMTPNLIMLGKETRLPADILYDKIEDTQEQLNVGEYTENLRVTLTKAHKIARKHLEKAYNRQKDQYNQPNRHQFFKPGDSVMILNEARKIGESKKLQPLYLGPVVVLEKINDLLYRIQMDEKGSQKCLNVDKMKKYEGDNHPPWKLNIVQQAC